MALPFAFNPRQSTSLGSGAEPRFELKILTDEHEREAAFALRGRAYAAMGHLHVDEASSFTDRFDQLATTALFGAYDGRRLVGAMRVSFSHPWLNMSSLPCAAYYPALADVKRAAPGSLIEISRMAIDADIDNRSYRTTLYASLVRAGYLAAEAARVSKILIATKPDWVRFYQYMLGFEVIGQPAKYPPGDFQITLLGGSLGQAQKRQRMQNAFFRITLDEIASMRRALAPQLARPAAAASGKSAAVR
ncbi:MAG: N-acyl amino acid synthase FeeM domain-containing protein [Hyphomicrobium sp.]